jgi:hypothetical protein
MMHGPRLWPLLTALILLGLGIRLMIGGLPVQTAYPFATGILLDGGSRLVAGQEPYRDFHTPIGFSYLGLLAGFLRLSDGLPHALATLSATMGIVIGAWAWWIASARCTPILSAAVSILCGLLVASPALFGYGPLEVSYGGHYSRLAWAVLATVIIQASLPSIEKANAPRMWIEALGLGLCLGLLLGTKFTFLFAALAILAISWLIRTPSSRQLTAIILGCMSAIAAGLLASGASLPAYLLDCSGLGGSVSAMHLLRQYLRELDFLGLALIGAVAVWTWPVHRMAWQRSWKTPIPEAPMLATVVLVLGLVLSATTGIEDASPCYLFSLLILASIRTDARHIAMHGARLICCAMFCAFSIRLAVPILKGPYARDSQYLVLPAGPWRALDFMPAVPGTTDRDALIRYLWIQPNNLVDNLWFLYLSDGDRILRPVVGPTERVLCLDYANPFPYLLERPAPRGDHLYWSFDRNVTMQTAPVADDLFADVDWVMIPKLELFNHSSSLKQRLYLPWIKEHYRLHASSTWWDCYHRTPSHDVPEVPAGIGKAEGGACIALGSPESCSVE